MAYVISNTAGNRNFQIADQVINQETTINLIGRNFPNYGEPIAENFVRLLENFANTLPPARALPGQIWFDNASQQLRVRDQNGFWKYANTVRVTQSDYPASSDNGNNTGAMYFDQQTGVLYVSATDGGGNTGKWKPASRAGEVIDPANYFGNVIANAPGSVSSYGTQLKNLFITDDTGVQRAVLALELVQGSTETIMAIFSDHAEFEANTDVVIFSHGEPKSNTYTQQISASNGIGTTIHKGLNLRGDNRTRVEVSNVSDYANLAFALNTGSYENGVANLALTITADNVAHQDADFVPNTPDAHDLGNSTNMFSNVYATTLWLGNEVSGGIVKNGNSTVVIGDAQAPIDDGYFEDLVVTGTLFGDVAGNLTGNVLSGNGNTVILSNGTDGTDAVFTGNVIGQVSDLSNHTTTDLAEGDNLYYTTARVRNNVSVDAQSNLLYSNVTGVFSHQLTTTDVAEGDNLYYTTARIRGNVDAVTVPNVLGELGNLSYNQSTGVFTFAAPSAESVRDHINASASISFSNADGVVSVIPAGVDHNQLNNYVSNKHVDHTEVFVVAGAGLAGTGDITSNVTLNIGQGFGITVNSANIAANVTQIRSLLSIGVGSSAVLSYNNTTGQITFLGDPATATSPPGRWVFSGNVNQSVSGEKNFSRSTTFSLSNGPNILIENEPTIRYSGGSNPTGLRFESSTDPGNNVITFSLTGGIVASDDITAFSDRKLKTDLEQITGALDRVSKLTGYNYTRVDQPGERHTGLIAQDVQEVLPEAVSEHNGTLAVAYGNMMGLIVESIKELQQQVADLQGRLGD